MRVVTNGGRWCILRYKWKYLNLGGQPVLIGSYRYALDGKGRVFLPAKWRAGLGDTLVLFPGILETGRGRCLYGMPEAAWNRMSEQLSRLPITDLAAQTVKRRLCAMAAACAPDSQGRILIPQQLRDTAELQREAVLIGVGERIEFWNPETLKRYEESTEAELDAALRHLSEIGI